MDVLEKYEFDRIETDLDRITFAVATGRVLSQEELNEVNDYLMKKYEISGAET